MFESGDIIDGKYRVEGVCSDTGGMGSILFVEPLDHKLGFRVVLKYCRENDPGQVKRFRREVRLLGSFKGNSKVVQIVDRNLEHDPPFFVMKYYPDGDLSTISKALRESHELQESTFLQMIECLQELHLRNEFHRDIKPQNFLRDGDQILVSDLGLSTEVGSKTAFTRSSEWWGTHGFIPPEFLQGGFKDADAPGDIFMLGKTLYVLLTGRDPTYIVEDDIPAPILHVLERCVSIPKANRYQTLSELKQSLAAAYDVLLERAGGLGKSKQLLSAINDRLAQEHKYTSEAVLEFIEQLALLDETDQIRLCNELSGHFFSAMRQGRLIDRLPEFLSIYGKLVESDGYSWSYAETVAHNMRTIFTGPEVPNNVKGRALHLAVQAAHLMNRFAAMNTCIAMVTSVDNEALGLEIAAILEKNKDTFIVNVEASECQSQQIRDALRRIAGE